MRQPAKGDRPIHTPHSAAQVLNEAAYLLADLLTTQGHPLATQARKIAIASDDFVDTLAPAARTLSEAAL